MNNLYYFNLLNEKEQTIYEKISDAWDNHSKSINISIGKYSENIDYKKLFTAIIYDNPKYFYVDRKKLFVNNTGRKIELTFNYTYKPENSDNFNISIEKELDIFFEKKLKYCKNDFEKVQLIHNYIIKKAQYPTKKPYSASCYTIIGVFCEGKAVCEGMSKAFKLMCDKSGIKSFVIIGTSLESKKKNNHSWNIVYIDGMPYHIDVTWDSSLSMGTNIAYDYFCISNSEISANHLWNDDGIFYCSDNSKSYYAINNLVIESVDELKNKISENRKLKYLSYKLNFDLDDSSYNKLLDDYVKSSGDISISKITTRYNRELNIISIYFHRKRN